MQIKIDSLDSIREAAREFVKNMSKGNVYAFYGKMGAGKTTFIKAVCEELGVNDVITSPTLLLLTNIVRKLLTNSFITSIFIVLKSLRKCMIWDTKIISTVVHSAF